MKSGGSELLKIIPDGTISICMLSDKIITKSANLFSELPHSLPEELIEILVDAPNVRIERIVSTGHASPPGFWYDQAESEWVVVLCGEAVLAFEDETRIMRPGDYVLIPPHRKHRVNSTSLTEPTVWLAVFFGGLHLSKTSQCKYVAETPIKCNTCGFE